MVHWKRPLLTTHLFNINASSCALDTAPLTAAMLERLNVVQRCMMRRMVGWICYQTDSWEERGRRMKQRLQHALTLHPVMQWSEQYARRKSRVKANMQAAPLWTQAAYMWNPVACASRNNHTPYRNVGRPRVQW